MWPSTQNDAAPDTRRLLGSHHRLHALGQIWLGSLDEELVMDGHCHERMELPTVDADSALQPMQPLLAVRIIPHNGTPLIAP